VKNELLKVSKKMLEQHTAESAEVTAQLARSLRRLIKAHVHAAITGLAAPGGSETKSKPVGTVFIAVYYQRKMFAERKVFRGTPKEIMQKACDEMYAFILKVVRKGSKWETTGEM
jgi:nicotinamide-nucleotide amidase